jgi:16S rRNA (adenine1518-N6/adenine1519-N6)-dimethyltransferase
MWPRAKKRFSQNFLKDPRILAKIVEAAEIQPRERVLEIGPGTGELTQVLVQAGACILAVELDKDLIPALIKRFGNTIDLKEGDIFDAITNTSPARVQTFSGEVSLSDGAYKIVSNIPYAITSLILERFLSAPPRPSRLVLTLQREVADRMMAVPPKMSLLSVVCQLYAEVHRVTRVPKGAFVPVPRVDSAVVCMDMRKDVCPKEIEPVIALARQGFSARRKQLHHNLRGWKGLESGRVKEILSQMELDPCARAENLAPMQWRELYERWVLGFFGKP